jgi:hypothetical protein
MRIASGYEMRIRNDRVKKGGYLEFYRIPPKITFAQDTGKGILRMNCLG